MLRVEVVHRVWPSGAQEVHGSVGSHHLSNCMPELPAQPVLEAAHTESAHSAAGCGECVKQDARDSVKQAAGDYAQC